MKKIRYIMMLCVMIIIVIVIGIIVMKNSKIEEKMVIENEKVMGIGEFTEETLQDVNIDELMRINECIQKYLLTVNIRSNLYYGKDENGDYTKLVEDDYIKQRTMDLLSTQYIDDNKITINNVTQYVDFSTTDQEYLILNVEKQSEGKIQKFLTHGILSENNQLKEETNYLIILDSVNATFSIEQIKEDASISNLKYNQEDVETNNNNKIPVVAVNAENISEFYFNLCKKISLLEPNYIYDRMNEEYREKRFKSKENFKEFIDKNANEIEQLTLSKYKMDSNNENVEYVFMDQYSNTYVVNTQKSLDYNIKLDTYTILSENFKKTYDTTSVDRKVMMNADKWIQMLNNRDYTTAYNVLDETFRNNNYGSEEEFERVMRERLPLHYSIEFNNYLSENETYAIDISLKDISQTEAIESEKISIIMQLKDDYEFVMSFNIE